MGQKIQFFLSNFYKKILITFLYYRVRHWKLKCHGKVIYSYKGDFKDIRTYMWALPKSNLITSYQNILTQTQSGLS